MFNVLSNMHRKERIVVPSPGGEVLTSLRCSCTHALYLIVEPVRRRHPHGFAPGLALELLDCFRLGCRLSGPLRQILRRLCGCALRTLRVSPLRHREDVLRPIGQRPVRLASLPGTHRAPSRALIVLLAARGHVLWQRHHLALTPPTVRREV